MFLRRREEVSGGHRFLRSREEVSGGRCFLEEEVGFKGAHVS